MKPTAIKLKQIALTVGTLLLFGLAAGLLPIGCTTKKHSIRSPCAEMATARLVFHDCDSG